MDNETTTSNQDRRRRRARTRRRLSYTIAIVASLVIAFIVYTKSRFLPNRVSTYVNEHYLADSPFEFQCGRISGDFVNRIVLRNPVLRYHSDAASFNVFKADEIAVDYKLFDALKLNLVVEDLRLDNVRLQIRKDTGGALVLPFLADTSAVAGLGGGVLGARVDVRRFEIDGLQMLFGDGERELAVRDVNLAGSFGLDGTEGRLTPAGDPCRVGRELVHRRLGLFGASRIPRSARHERDRLRGVRARDSGRQKRGRQNPPAFGHLRHHVFYPTCGRDPAPPACSAGRSPT